MVHLHVRIQRLKSTKKKPHHTYLEDKIKTNVVFCTTVDSSTTKEVKFYSGLCGRFSTTSVRGNKYIYVMYVYGFNSILTQSMENRSDK